MCFPVYRSGLRYSSYSHLPLWGGAEGGAGGGAEGGAGGGAEGGAGEGQGQMVGVEKIEGTYYTSHKAQLIDHYKEQCKSTIQFFFPFSCFKYTLQTSSLTQ